jgi:site-specific recombinase XerC
MAVAIVRAREIIERAEQGAREKAGSCEIEVANYLDSIRKMGLSKSTITSRRYVLSGLIDQLGVRSPTSITRSSLQRWFDALKERNPHTAVAYLNIARFWMKWLVKTGRINRDLTKDVEVPRLPMRQRRNFLLPKQARLLIDSADNRDMKFALYCGIHAGLRKLEVVEARSNWFDLDAKLLHVQATETFQPKDRIKRGSKVQRIADQK